MSYTKPLWLVQPRLDAGDYRDKLIGSVVKHLDLPIERHIPCGAGAKMPLQLVANLDPKPVQVRSVKFWTRRIKDAVVSAKLNEILDAFVDQAKEDSSEKMATVARVWHMDSPDEKIKQLLEDKQYREELFELLRENHGKGYFITDIVTLTNMETSDSTRENGYSGCYEDETIILLGYRLVRLEKVEGTRAKLGQLFKNGLTGFSYWPEMVEAVEDEMKKPQDKGSKSGEESAEFDAIVKELGCDFEVVG